MFCVLLNTPMCVTYALRYVTHTHSHRNSIPFSSDRRQFSSLHSISEIISLPLSIHFLKNHGSRMHFSLSHHFANVINFVRHVRTGSVASFGLISKTMLRTQTNPIHPPYCPFLKVRFSFWQFSNIECLWVGFRRISSVPGI